MIEETWSVSRSVKSRPTAQVLAKLMEEVGEFAKEISIKNGWLRKEPGKDGVLGEGCDVINCVLDLIWLDNPEITQEEMMDIFRKKLQKWYQYNS